MCLILLVTAYPALRLTGYAQCGVGRNLPGEFERQQAIWMMWPTESCNLDYRQVNLVMLNLIKNLAKYVKVNIMTTSDIEVSQIKALAAQNGCCKDNISYYIVSHHSIWTRDVGPTFVKDNRGNLSAVSFGFSNYDHYHDDYYIAKEDRVDERIAGILGLPLISSKLISEGGSIESNGKGTILLCESVTLKRNANLTKQQIEAEYKRVLGVRKIIWLKNGLAEDTFTGGHVDEFVRFANPHTILLAQVMPEDKDVNRAAKQSYLNLEQNFKILANARDQNGKPFDIIRVPMPPALYREADNVNEAPVRSYLNYIVTNGAVLVQTYWEPGRPNILKITDDKVKYTLHMVFPERDIIEIKAESINIWGGGIHCVTLHMPA